MKIPRHIAIIMDGNGRWAGEKGVARIMGHRQGVERLKEIAAACVRLGVRYLTVYAFSTENWQRPKKEVKAIFGLLEGFLDREVRLFQRNKVKLRIIGDRDKIWPRLREKIEKAERDTASNNVLVLNVALSYGGRQEIINAVRRLSQKVKNGTIRPSDIDEGLFSEYLYTRGCPDPDLLIRTSGEMRVSNFLLWQISYTEIYVTEKLWPDFRERDLKRAMEGYGRRERRFGR